MSTNKVINGSTKLNGHTKSTVQKALDKYSSSAEAAQALNVTQRELQTYIRKVITNSRPTKTPIGSGVDLIEKVNRYVVECRITENSIQKYKRIVISKDQSEDEILTAIEDARIKLALLKQKSNLRNYIGTIINDAEYSIPGMHMKAGTIRAAQDETRMYIVVNAKGYQSKQVSALNYDEFKKSWKTIMSYLSEIRGFEKVPKEWKRIPSERYFMTRRSQLISQKIDFDKTRAKNKVAING